MQGTEIHGTFENVQARRVYYVHVYKSVDFHVQGTEIHGVYNLTDIARCTIMAL